ncbi:MAG: PRC and DUF2382 domain-containing protein [Acidobacteriota bacterium]|nr:PRC and DUF2382 domain-containing protein [Acidobacteriota bacterium]
MAILYYSQQDEFDLVNTGQDCMGWSVVDQAGTPIGTVTEMLIDPDAEMVDSILVDRKKRIPAGDIALRDGRVVVRGIMQDGNLEMTESMTTTTTTETENQNYTAMQREANARHVSGVTREASENEVVLPIVEEQLRIGKRTVERGGVNVRTTSQEVPVQETVNLREENVTVERRPVDRAVGNAPDAFREGTIEITETAEVPVVSKEARVVEEVVVGKEVTERQETVRDTVKRTEVEVDEVNQTDNRNRQNG